MILEEVEAEKIMHIIVGGIFRLGDFLQDHRAFALDLFGIEIGMEKNIGQKINRQRQVFIEHLGVVASMLFGRERVEHPAHRIHFLSDLGGTAPFGAFEKQMLDKVGYAVLRSAFVARTVLHPDTETDGTMSCISCDTTRMPLSRTVLTNMRSQKDRQAGIRLVGIAAELLHRFFAAQPNFPLPVDLEDFDHHFVTFLEHVGDFVDPLRGEL